MIVVEKRTELRGRIKKVIHVNGSVIRRNKRTGAQEPHYTVKCVDGNFYCRAFQVNGTVVGVSNYTQRHRSGAVAWLETRDPMTLFPE